MRGTSVVQLAKGSQYISRQWDIWRVWTTQMPRPPVQAISYVQCVHPSRDGVTYNVAGLIHPVSQGDVQLLKQ